MANKTGTQKICHFGTFSTEQLYSHNALVAQSLTKAGWEVIDCRPASRVNSGSSRAKSFSGIFSFLGSVFSLLKQWVELFFKHSKVPRYDLMVVGYPSHADMFLAYVLCKWRRCPLVMDSFYGLYNTVVEDRKLISAGNPLSKIMYAWEYVVLHLADYVLIDTEAQADMLKERYRLADNRFFSVPVGIDEELWTASPVPVNEGVLRVALWATFIPLHGMNTVVEAAHLLEVAGEKIEIEVWGDGQTADAFAELKAKLEPQNLSWNRSIYPLEEIADFARGAHCCIGILGGSDKALNVVPYKVTQALALGRAVVTVASDEIKKILIHEEEALLIPPDDATALAEALTRLAHDHALCESLGAGGRLAYEKHLSNEVMQRVLANTCASIAEKK